MKIRQQIQQWNKDKWESKNRAMYENFSENQWPWFNDQLDADIDEYLIASGIGPVNVLDLGTCSGSQAIELARRGHHVIGTDISETALAQAISAASRQNSIEVGFLLDDITDSALHENQFDLVLDRGCYHSICCLQHLDYIKGVKRVLRPDGILLLKTMSSEEKRFISYDAFGNKSIQMPLHFSRELLKESLSPYFQVQEIRDSCFFSTVVEPPARALFAILRNTK